MNFRTMGFAATCVVVIHAHQDVNACQPHGRGMADPDSTSILWRTSCAFTQARDSNWRREMPHQLPLTSLGRMVRLRS